MAYFKERSQYLAEGIEGKHEIFQKRIADFRASIRTWNLQNIKKKC